jgi:hypothetical protein
MAWVDLRPERIAELKKRNFEEFCADLIWVETCDRHRDARTSSPMPEDVTDGGRDVLLTVVNPAIESKQSYQQKHSVLPLTEDLPAGASRVEIAYSCKSGKNWLDLALDNLDPSKRKGTPRSVEVLLAGGYFKLCINQIARLDRKYKRNNDERTPEEHLAHAFWERMKEVDPNAPDPSSRIAIVDASTITRFLQGRRPEGFTDRWAEELGLLPLLRSLDEWRNAHRENRGSGPEPSFVEDAERSDRRAELASILLSEAADPGERIVWLYGAPGVGKSRLVLELLDGEKRLAERARIAWTHEEARDAINQLFDRYSSALLVVDDCSEGDVDGLEREFRRVTRNRPFTHLLLVIPAASPVDAPRAGHYAFSLTGLDERAILDLIAEISAHARDSEEVHTIARLSEGYPWFARLLSEELRALNHAPRTIEQAVDWALASHWEKTDEDARKKLRNLRARCLLAASVTREVDWDQLDPDGQDDLAKAVGVSSWSELHGAAKDCRARGILRSRLGWQFKYVTPLILEREIVRRMLGPGGPDPGGRRLATWARPHLSSFFERIEQLGLPRDTLEGMARAVLDDAEASRDWDSWHEHALVGARLDFLARHVPAAAGRVLRQRIEQSPIDELRMRTDVRRDIVFALASISERRYGFEDAEAALFRLARAENETFGNNATQVWANLFLAELNATQRSLRERLDVLEHRLGEPEAAARQVALGGLRALLRWQSFRLGTEGLDGPPIAPSAEDAYRGRVRGWELLAARCADPEPSVARAARQAAIKLLRSAVRTGVADEAGELLTKRLDSFDERERLELREVLTDLQSYEGLSLRASDDDGLGMLASRLEARTFRERLLDRVGSWASVRREEDTTAGDEALAREALSIGTPIRDHFSELYAEDNVRAGAFVRALGRLDVRSELYDDFEQRAMTPRGRWLLACYLAGRADTGQTAIVERALDELHRDEQGALAVAVILSLMGATDERLGWLEADVLARRLDEQALMMLRRRGWLEEVSDHALGSFTRALNAVGDAAHATVALVHLVDRFRRESVDSGWLFPQLERAFAELAGAEIDGGAWGAWQRAADILLTVNDVSRVAALACVALSGPHGPDVAWRVLRHCTERDAVTTWRAVASVLERGDEAARRLVLALRFHRKPFIWPYEEVLAWVGTDERRGLRVVWLTQPDEEAFAPLLHGLIRQFGHDSRVADEMIARFHSTDGLVSSLAERDAQRLERVRRWLVHGDPTVRAWVERLVDSLERSHERHAAHEEHEREELRPWAT